MALGAEHAPAFFKRNSLPSFTLIHGEEPLLNQEALDAARKAAHEANFIERQRLDISTDAQWKMLLTEIDTPSLFAPKRIIECHVDDKKLRKIPAEIIQTIAGLPESSKVRIIMHAPNLEYPQKTTWFKYLITKKTLEIRSMSLSQKDFEQQIINRLGAAKLRLNNNAHELLLRLVEGNLLAAQQAISRLSYHPHHQQILSAEDLRQTLSDLSRFSCTEFKQAIFHNRWLEAYRIAKKLAAEDSNQLGLIIWQFERDFSLLLQLKTQSSHTWKDIFTDYRIYFRQQSEYSAALANFSAGLLTSLVALTKKLDAIRKGAEPGDAWLTLTQYLLIRAQSNHQHLTENATDSAN